jgi:hypothetical protein
VRLLPKVSSPHVLACATGITLYFRWPFPENDLMLRLISIRAPLIYAGFKYTYTLFLFTTPYIGYRFCGILAISLC